MTINLAGSGNVATVLGTRLLQAGYPIQAVFSRNAVTGRRLAESLNCGYVADPGLLPAADMLLLALPDDALHNLGDWLPWQQGLLAHTAGSVSREVLAGFSHNYGVFYPLQSLRAEKPNGPEFPLIVDGNSPDVTTLLHDLAADITPMVYQAGDEQRRQIHLAAVLASNFTNYLYSVANDYCREQGLDFSVLLPLIEETTRRLREFAPDEVQTGPAVRGDRQTQAAHLELLRHHPAWQELYRLLSAGIAKRHGVQ